MLVFAMFEEHATNKEKWQFMAILFYANGTLQMLVFVK
jgi:hypothetical protein